MISIYIGIAYVSIAYIVGGIVIYKNLFAKKC